MSKTFFVAMSAWEWDPTDPKAATFSFTRGGRRVAIDSTRRPGGGLYDDAVVDDNIEGATTVDKPTSSGALYVEQGYAIANRFPRLPEGYDDYVDRDYEFKTVQYSRRDGQYPGFRYYGFHALWLAGDVSSATILVFNAGASKSTDNGNVLSITYDLKRDELFLPAVESGYPFPRRGDAAGGCLFIRCKEAATWSLSIPKLPQVLVTASLGCPAADR
jgi:hypothetical protein